MSVLTWTILAIIFLAITLFFPKLISSQWKWLLFIWFLIVGLLVALYQIISDLSDINKKIEEKAKELKEIIDKNEAQKLISESKSFWYNHIKLVELMANFIYKKEINNNYRQNVHLEIKQKNIFRIEYELYDILGNIKYKWYQMIYMFLSWEDGNYLIKETIVNYKKYSSDEIIFITSSDNNPKDILQNLIGTLTSKDDNNIIVELMKKCEILPPESKEAVLWLMQKNNMWNQEMLYNKLIEFWNNQIEKITTIWAAEINKEAIQYIFNQ